MVTLPRLPGVGGVYSLTHEFEGHDEHDAEQEAEHGPPDVGLRRAGRSHLTGDRGEDDARGEVLPAAHEPRARVEPHRDGRSDDGDDDRDEDRPATWPRFDRRAPDGRCGAPANPGTTLWRRGESGSNRRGDGLQTKVDGLGHHRDLVLTNPVLARSRSPVGEDARDACDPFAR